MLELGLEHKTRHEKELRTKQGRGINAACRSHLQSMKLLQKSPLDSSPLGKGTGYFEEIDAKQEFFSEKEQRGPRGREREREADASDYAKTKRQPQL